MREIKIKVHSNKKMSCLNGSFTCKKGENKIDVLVFDVDENLLQYNNFLILKSPNGTTYVDIVLSDMKYSIGSFITNELGNWTIQFLSSTQEDIVSEEEIDETQTIMISDTLSFNVIDSLASGELVLPPTSSNLDLLGEQLATIYKTLSVVIEEYDDVENYIELQEELKVIEDMIANIKVEVDTSDLKVSVDMSETNAKIDDLDSKVSNIPTNDYSDDLGQIQSDVTNIKGRVSTIDSMLNFGVISPLNSIKMNGEDTLTNTNTILNRMGDNDTKANGTLFNYSYWGLVRAEEAKIAANNNNAMLQTIYTQMSDANTLTNEILTKLEG
jgi:hypothetical protein